MKLIYAGSAFLIGIYLGTFAPGFPVWIYAIPLPLLVFLVFRRRLKALSLVVICLLLLAAGSWRGHSSAGSKIGDLSSFNGEGVVELTGKIQTDPETLDKSVRFAFQVDRVVSGQSERQVSGQVLVYASLLPPANNTRQFPYFRYGDTLTIRGRLEMPGGGNNPGYRQYLANHGIGSTLSFPQRVSFLAGSDQAVVPWIYGLRTNLSRSLQSLLPEPQASLAEGIILGIRTNIPKTLSDAFMHTGTTHVLAISGQNLTIIAGLLTALAVWLLGRRRQLYIILAVVSVWFYAILAGMGPSVLRAVIMATVFLSAHLFGRPGSAAPAMVFAAAVMVGWQPAILSNVSFQLSFLAILGLIYLAPPMQAAGAGWTEDGVREHWWGTPLAMVMDALAVSLSAVLFTLPVIAYNFHTLSPSGIPATLLLLPVLPSVMLLSGAAAFAGLFIPALAHVLAWMAWLPLSFMVAVVTVFDRLPLSFFQVESFGAAQVAGYFAALAAGVWIVRNPCQCGDLAQKALSGLRFLKPALAPCLAFFRPNKYSFAVLLIAAFLLWIGAANAPDGNLHVTFFGPGEGESVLIRTPSGKNILIGGGPSPEKLNLALGKTLPFWDRKIDLLVLASHEPTAMPGLTGVLRHYSVERVIEPHPGALPPPAGYREWRRELGGQAIPVTPAVTGQRIDLGRGFVLSVLHAPEPPASAASIGDSGSPIVLKVLAGEVSILVTLPASLPEVLALLDRRVDLISTVFQAGSATLDAPSVDRLLEAVSPQILVVSRRTASITVPTTRTGASIVAIKPDAAGVELITDGQRLWYRDLR